MSLWAPRETQVFSPAPSTVRLAVTATAVAGLTARMPSMLTRPAPISSAACWRERARPRRTSSASTRARRVTLTSALLHRFQRSRPGSGALPRADGRRRRYRHRRRRDVSGSTLGSWASTASISARICSGSVFISPFTLADPGSRAAATSAPARRGRCRHRRAPLIGRPSGAASHTARATARTTDSPSPSGSPPVAETVTASVADLDAPGRVRGDRRGCRRRRAGQRRSAPMIGGPLRGAGVHRVARRC